MMIKNEKLQITITDKYGSKHYSVNKFIKKFLIYFSLFIALSLGFSGVIIHYLYSEVSNLKSETDRLIDKKNSLETKNKKLIEKINTKSNQLGVLNNKLQNIEEILGLKPKEKENISIRLDEIHTDAKLKSFILKIIPNGSPVPFKGLTGKFGWRVHPILNKKEFHTGLDLRAGMKTKIVAPADGVVEYAGIHKKSGYGVLLIIDHGYGFKTMYGHLYKCKAKSGDYVKKGDVIAYTGNSGLSSGPHLHYEVRYIQIALNPKNFIDWNIKNFNSIFTKERTIKWQSLVNQIKRHSNLMAQQP